MSKLSQIFKALEGNTSIVVVERHDRNFIPYQWEGYWNQTVDLIVAPRKGIFEADKLEKFMMSLVPKGIKPSQVDHFRDTGDEVELGVLYFDEDIGTQNIHREIELTDEELFGMDGFTADGKKVIIEKERLRRRTWVRLFPSEAVARARIRGELRMELYVNKNDLWRFQRK